MNRNESLNHLKGWNLDPFDLVAKITEQGIQSLFCRKWSNLAKQEQVRRSLYESMID